MNKEEIIKYWNKNRDLINQRYEEFKELADYDRVRKELLFCLLTPMSKPENALSVLIHSKLYEFEYMSPTSVQKKLENAKIRFAVRKATYIYELFTTAKGDKHTRHIVKNLNNLAIRDFIADNIKGIGYKEASHFLRNIGREDIAILDRHILRSLKELGIIETDEYPKKREEYLDIESKYLEFANSLGISGGKLDLVLFGMQTGKIIK